MQPFPPFHNIDQVLSPEASCLFTAHCRLLLREELEHAHVALHRHLAELQEALHNNEFLDIELAHQIAAVLELLLADYSSFSPEHQAYIAGAVAYFISTEDSEPDLESIVGFDDDRQVLNYVLTVIGWDNYQV